MAGKIWTSAKRALLGLLVLILVLIGGGLVYRAFRHHELAKATPIDAVHGIDEALFTKIGGIDQWIGCSTRTWAFEIFATTAEG